MRLLGLFPPAPLSPPRARAALQVIPKSPEEVSSIKDSISNDSKLGWFFNTLEEEQLEDVLNAFECKEPAEGDAVITQGDEGDNFYLVASGTFKAYVGGNEVFTYEGKGSFGELAGAAVQCAARGHREGGQRRVQVVGARPRQLQGHRGVGHAREDNEV